MLGLVGDIGGTNARFALVEETGGRPVVSDPKGYANKDYGSPEDAIAAYLKDTGAGQPAKAVLAVAGPVTHGAVHFTNLDWEVSETRLTSVGGFTAARLLNDFAAQALGAVRVTADKLQVLGPEIPRPEEGASVILGPGTGFGVAGLVRQGGSETVLATEGGHVGFAPTDEVEIEIWLRFARGRERVSIERVLSGSGLFELYQALADIEGAPAALADQRAVQAAAESGDPLASRAVDRFCRILGSTAGDFALGYGARAGIYVTGGVAEKLADQLAKGGFRERFEAKGRFEAYMRAIPTWLVLDPYAALIGAASQLSSLEPA
ncbi:MAG TPA: glucokinase [Caulobacteraceae bacterium]